MKSLRPFIICLLLLIPAMAVVPARAEGFITPNMITLLHALVRTHALDISDSGLLGEYAMLSACEDYHQYYQDDFKWQKIRTDIFNKAMQERDAYPLSFSYVMPVRLGRYDFDKQLYRFDDKTAMHNVNAILMSLKEEAACGTMRTVLMPRAFRAYLTPVIDAEGVVLAQGDAEALLKRMTTAGNEKRFVFARINFTVTYVEPLHKVVFHNGAPTIFAQSEMSPNEPVRLDSRLESVDFYEDEAASQKLLYTYKP
ncbi:MAG: DUF4852 domain-containing protein [Alphaproteobacteria bacterium]|nr:DUF4852 domain-containing protein [Alphaproteobacteria bacterium]MBV8547867.1 DUF4852 domain-containing protein [Alphaproteobacteria bacterium]